MLTAYDYPTAKIFDEAGIPVLLVGDSVGNTILGYENTLPVTMDEMLHHTRAVARGVTNALVVGDMPFLSYQVSVEEGVRNAGRFLKEGGAGAVKIEGAQVELVHRLVDLGIPVMAHVGLTPQSVHAMGGYRVQGRGEEAARVTDQALALEKAGAFAIVLEAMPSELGAELTTTLQIPTIGIGAGRGPTRRCSSPPTCSGCPNASRSSRAPTSTCAARSRRPRPSSPPTSPPGPSPTRTTRTRRDPVSRPGSGTRAFAP
jgi:3-methyl-2-oxobutanoate hydroxymethyltransferase